MLELDHVTIAYGETQAVEDFSLHMEPGEIVSLVGESGSGKTSVIRGSWGCCREAVLLPRGILYLTERIFWILPRSSGAPSEGGRFP